VLFVIIEKLNKLSAMVVVLALVLVIDGFLLYRFSYQRTLPSAENIAATTNAENVTFENDGERADETKALVHHAWSHNIVSNYTYIDDSLSNENPDAILLAERTSPYDKANDEPRAIGVWYNADLGKWAVFNQDLSPMRRGLAFNINMVQEPSESVFVHRATPDNTVENETYIDHVSTNQNPDAVLKVTPNFNPGGGAGTFNDHPLDVRYDTDKEKWAIVNTDLKPMPPRAAFNVGIFEDTTTDNS
jgi:hypothetical protein